MKLVGTISEAKNEKGFYTLRVRGLEVPLRGIAGGHAGKRTYVKGAPVWNPEKGSYFRVKDAFDSTAEDSNTVEVEGVITRVYPECKNARNRRSVCFILRQSRDKSSTVLVTALSGRIEALQPASLQVGERIRVRGYLSYHGLGLHIIYSQTVKRGVADRPLGPAV